MKTNPLYFRIENKTNKFLLILLVFIGLVFPGLSMSQSLNDIEAGLEVKHTTSPVKVDGNVLFYVRGISSFPSEQRASAIIKRIKNAAENPLIPADSVILIPSEGKFEIYAGEEFIMNVYNIDAINEEVNQKDVAGLFQSKISQAIQKYRNDRSRPVLLKNMVYALGAILLLILILFVLLWIIRKINAWIENKIKTSIDSLENKSFQLIRSNQLWKIFFILTKTFRILITILVLSLFLNYILGLFPWTSGVASFTLDIFLKSILTVGKGILQFIPKLFILIIIFLVTRYLLKIIKLLFDGVDKGSIIINNFHADWAIPTFKILRIFIIAFAIIIAYPYIPGSGSSAFKGVSVFLGILFSLGSSSFISNVIAGYSMTYRRAFKKGDRIKVNDHIGFVEEQKLLVTRLCSLKNEEIIIPNSVLLNSHIINYSARAKDRGLILHTTVGIGYETPWRQVDAMLMLAANRTEGILKEPPPFVLKQSLGDFAVNYEINAYCDDVSKMHIYYTLLHQNILDIFNENNVQIMTPAYEGDPEIPKVVPKDQWNVPLANEN